jgi:hypothetical protein
VFQSLQVLRCRGSSSGCGIWSTHACDDKKSLKRFLAEKGEKGDLAFKRKLQATVGSLCKIHKAVEWMENVDQYSHEERACLRMIWLLVHHKGTNQNANCSVNSLETWSQKCWKIEAPWVGGFSICCDLKDCEEAGGSSYRQLMIHRHKVPCALTTLYIVHHYILHCTKWHTLL